MVEEWRSVKGYEGYYEVSNFGQVRSIDRLVDGRKNVKMLFKGKLLKQLKNHKGYFYVPLTMNSKKKGITVHRLVAKAFIESNGKQQVNHKDSNKENNNVSNLEWCTNAENQIHANLTGRLKKWGVAFYPKKARKINMEIAREIRKMAKNNIPQRKIANLFKISQASVSCVISNKTYCEKQL